MKFKHIIPCVLVALVAATSGTTAYGQLFTEDFDDGNASTRWVANNPGVALDGLSPIDTNFDEDADGITDNTSGFAFDYSTVGIPSAPNSNGTTIGLKLQANLFFGAFGGFSVSPIGQSFTGDYTLSYDMWQNHNGPLNGTAAGSTTLSYGGIMTDGETPHMAGNGDGVWFAATGDGGSNSDYRVYSYEKQVSYQAPAEDEIDEHANYFAGGRNSTEAYYDQFNPDAGGDGVIDGLGPLAAPADQLNSFPGQTGNVRSGSLGFAWRHHEITKVGNLITWTVDDLPLITLDLTNVDPELSPGGENILFGFGDTNSSSPPDIDAPSVLFGLVDNVVVSELTAMADNADFNDDGLVDGEDFLIWQRGFGTPDAHLADGDANGDLAVNADDLAVWTAQYGTAPAGISAVPEPTSLVCLLALSLLAAGGRPRTESH